MIKMKVRYVSYSRVTQYYKTYRREDGVLMARMISRLDGRWMSDIEPRWETYWHEWDEEQYPFPIYNGPMKFPLPVQKSTKPPFGTRE